ncbi:MAG TPA: GNAT family N-acetyltransferase [Streptosporangiaceae bacterium]|nr:GNAT family N-acetyltransferase [Streptosporangiaceae bacterium]
MTSRIGLPTVTSPVPRPVWESLIQSDADAVVSQSPAWRDALCAAGGYQDVSRLYEFPSGHSVILPLARRRWPRWLATAASWPGAWGVGGPISQNGRIDAAEAAAVLADAAQQTALGVKIQLRYNADSAWLSEAGRFQVEGHGCLVLDLAGGFDQVWQHRFRGTARTAVRKAERSALDVDVGRSGRLLRVFCDLYEKSIQRWAGMQHEPVRLTRWRTTRETSPRMLASAASSFGPDCAIWVARSAGEPVAAIIVLRAGAYAKFWRGAMDKELAGPLRANELLHRLAIEEACRDQYRFYDMGFARPGSHLAEFKKKLGATLHTAHTLRAERLPLHALDQRSRGVVKRVIGFHDV